jgi:hypothetical protein
MTRIRLDPAAMRRSSAALDDAAVAVGSARARLRPDDVGGLPPSVAAFARSELSASSAVLCTVKPRLQRHSLELASRARRAELADAADRRVRAAARFADRSGLLDALGVADNIFTAVELLWAPRYLTRNGIVQRWRKTAGQSFGKRVAAFRGLTKQAGFGLRGAAARTAPRMFGRNAPLMKGAGVFVKRLPLLGDTLTATETFGRSLAENRSYGEATARATGAVVGSRGGMVAGAVTGAAIGTALGGPVGGVVGGVVVGVIGSGIGEGFGTRVGSAAHGIGKRVKGWFK